MLKQLILFLSLIHLMQCLSPRSNIWWSRRDESSQKDCDIQLNNENPSLRAKICGYCFAKCQQQFANCLLAQMSRVLHTSIDHCQEKSDQCEKRCLTDERTSQIAEANWAKVVQVLQTYHSIQPTGSEEEEVKKTQ